MSLTSYSEASHNPAESQLTSSNARGKKNTLVLPNSKAVVKLNEIVYESVL